MTPLLLLDEKSRRRAFLFDAFFHRVNGDQKILC